MLCFYLFSCVQIVLESFPVSSSGHVALLEKVLHNFFATDLLVVCTDSFFAGLQSEFVEHIIHGPTVFVLAFFFFDRWSFFLLHLRRTWKLLFKLMLLVGLADSVTAVFYFLFKVVDKTLFPTWFGFMITAAALASLLVLSGDQKGKFDWRKALVIGAIQGLSFLPGVSRLALTFVAGRWLCLSNRKAFEVSFLVQWPLIATAFFNSVVIRAIYKDTSALPMLFNFKTIVILCAAMIPAFFALRFVQRLAYKNKMWIFSVYLCVPTLVWLLL